MKRFKRPANAMMRECWLRWIVLAKMFPRRPMRKKPVTRILEFTTALPKENLKANVSCKLTQLGLDLSVEFCEGLVLSIAERAAALGSFLRIDMESWIYTQRTVELVKRVRAQTPCVGAVIQAYLSHRKRYSRPAVVWLPHPAVQGGVQGIRGSGVSTQAGRR